MNSSSLKVRSSPIQLLLLLEWVLLAVAAILQIWVALANPNFGFPVLNMLGLFLFAAMRLRLPHRWGYKLLYTAGEFALLLLLTFGGDLPAPLLLFVVLTIRNCVLLAGSNAFESRLRSIVTFLALAICLLSQVYRFWSRRMLLSLPSDQIGTVSLGFAILYVLVFLFLHLLIDAVLAERRGQEQLAVANMQLREYALRVEELATEQERNRIARDIHDSLGHSLTVFNIHTAAALRLLHTNLPEAESLLLELKQLGSQALEDVRESVMLLRADPLQGRSLSESIASLVKEFQRTTGILPTFNYTIAAPLNVELDFTIYRLVQESLTNIRRHAGASEVAIEISATTMEIIAIVRDNGKGFDPDRHTSGFGLLGMQERTDALGGMMTISTATDPHSEQLSRRFTSPKG
jgi:signal transduction histidine kinase